MHFEKLKGQEMTVSKYRVKKLNKLNYTNVRFPVTASVNVQAMVAMNRKDAVVG